MEASENEQAHALQGMGEDTPHSMGEETEAATRMPEDSPG